MGSYGFLLAKNGARVTGIDISDFAIQEARKKAQTDIVDISFRVMDAESLELPESSIDLICGTGILHHLSLERALPQIERVLAPNGKAYFIEPLGHNPVINFYRRLTPSLRSRDEHPLNAGDLGVIGTLFHRHSFEFYDLLTLFFLPFHKFRIFRPAHEFLTKLDHATFAVIPFLRKYSWQVLIILEK
jgi:ubiquinone/menaquinone biosynthesis C-methylase UbiE